MRPYKILSCIRYIYVDENARQKLWPKSVICRLFIDRSLRFLQYKQKKQLPCTKVKKQKSLALKDEGLIDLNTMNLNRLWIQC